MYKIVTTILAKEQVLYTLAIGIIQKIHFKKKNITSFDKQ